MFCPPVMIAVVTPTTSPARLNSGPPLEPLRDRRRDLEHRQLLRALQICELLLLGLRQRERLARGGVRAGAPARTAAAA